MSNRKTAPLTAAWTIVCLLGTIILSTPVLAHPPTQLATAIPTAGPIPGSIGIERTITPPALMPGQESEVTLQLTGQATNGCAGIPGRPVDMVLLFDVSASAGMGSGSNWEQTVSLTQELLDLLARPIYRTAVSAPEASRVAMISSQTGMLGPEPVLLQPLAEDYALLHAQVQSVVPGGDTDLAAGLRLAAQELAAVRDDRAQAVTLMLHDNTAIDEGLENAVGEVRRQGISVYLVANSLNIAAEKQITPAIATEIASSDEIWLDPAPADLLDLFITATEGDTDLAAADIVVAESFVPPGAVQVSAIQGPGGQIAPDGVVWTVPNMAFGQTVELAYRLSPTTESGVSIIGGLAWLDCNGYPQSNLGSATVSGGTPVATNTPQIIDVQTATPAPPPDTDAPTPNVPDAPDVPDVPDLSETPGVPSGIWGQLLSFISSLPTLLQWLLPLLLLFLIILLLWLLLRWLRRKPKSTGGPVAKPPRKPPTVEDLGKPKPQRRPGGDPLTSDWRDPETVTDRAGRSLTLRVGPRTDMVEQALVGGQNSTVIVRVEEGNQVIGRAELKLETVEETHPLSGETRAWRRAVLLEADALARLDENRGIDAMALSRAEAVARGHQAREMRGVLESAEAVPFFERCGYQVRRVPQGGYALFKSLAE